MTVDSTLFPTFLIWVAGILYGICLVAALRMAPWSRFRDSEQLHVFLGTLVVLLLLWHLQANVRPGLSYHLLGLTAVTLMFGWSLAVIAASLALAGVRIKDRRFNACFARTGARTGESVETYRGRGRVSSARNAGEHCVRNRWMTGSAKPGGWIVRSAPLSAQGWGSSTFQCVGRG